MRSIGGTPITTRAHSTDAARDYDLTLTPL